MEAKPSTDEIFALMTRGARIPLEEVKRHRHGALFPDPDARVGPRDPDCTARLELGNPVMLAELREVNALPEYSADDAYRFRLISRRLPDVHNSAGQDIPKLVKKWRYNPAFMHPEDLDALGLSTGDVVDIESDHASIVGVVESEAGLRPGVVSMAHAFGDAPTPARPEERGSNTGRLSPVDRDYDPYTGIPRMSCIRVNVKRREGRDT